MNLLAFLIDLYITSTRTDPNGPRLRSAARAFLSVKTWNRLEVAHILSDELWSNWFSLEQKARLSNVFQNNPNLGKLEIPMAWAVNEPLSTNWKASFETLRLWLPIKIREEQDENRLAAWVPMVWPSYLAAYRWQLLLATRSPQNQAVALRPSLIGFPSSGLVDSKILIPDLIEGVSDTLVNANVHFLLPEEAVLRLTNTEVPIFDERRGGKFSPWKYKTDSRPSGLTTQLTEYLFRELNLYFKHDLSIIRYVSKKVLLSSSNDASRIPCCSTDDEYFTHRTVETRMDFIPSYRLLDESETSSSTLSGLRIRISG